MCVYKLCCNFGGLPLTPLCCPPQACGWSCSWSTLVPCRWPCRPSSTCPSWVRRAVRTQTVRWKLVAHGQFYTLSYCIHTLWTHDRHLHTRHSCPNFYTLCELLFICQICWVALQKSQYLNISVILRNISWYCPGPVVGLIAQRALNPVLLSSSFLLHTHKYTSLSLSPDPSSLWSSEQSFTLHWLA